MTCMTCAKKVLWQDIYKGNVVINLPDMLDMCRESTVVFLPVPQPKCVVHTLINIRQGIPEVHRKTGLNWKGLRRLGVILQPS